MDGAVEETSDRVAEETICDCKECCETCFFSMKFDLLEHFCEDLDKPEGVRYVDASAYEKF